MHAKSLQSCLTLCDPIDGSPPGSPVPGILQARTLECVYISSPVHACTLSCFSRVWLCATPWTAAHQAPLSIGFSRQEYRSGWPFPSPSDPSMILVNNGYFHSCVSREVWQKSSAWPLLFLVSYVAFCIKGLRFIYYFYAQTEYKFNCINAFVGSLFIPVFRVKCSILSF